MTILQNPSEDSEIRIAAYKALMECPTARLLNQIKGVVDQEDSQQLDSYVLTHLTNLMETSDPHKQELKAILDTMILDDLDKDKTKFSRNYEKSIFLEKLNTGAKAEADVIWSSNSFIPRSGMVNLTVNLFGRSTTLFELGGRAQGLEYFMESMLGPNGYFSDNVPAASPDRALTSFNKLGRINKRVSSVCFLWSSLPFVMYTIPLSTKINLVFYSTKCHVSFIIHVRRFIGYFKLLMTPVNRKLDE